MNIEDISKKPAIPGTEPSVDGLKGIFRKALSDKNIEVSYKEDELVRIENMRKAYLGNVNVSLEEPEVLEKAIDQFNEDIASENWPFNLLYGKDGMQKAFFGHLEEGGLDVAQGVRELCSKYTKSLESVESFTALLKERGMIGAGTFMGSGLSIQDAFETLQKLGRGELPENAIAHPSGLFAMQLGGSGVIYPYPIFGGLKAPETPGTPVAVGKDTEGDDGEESGDDGVVGTSGTKHFKVGSSNDGTKVGSSNDGTKVGSSNDGTKTSNDGTSNKADGEGGIGIGWIVALMKSLNEMRNEEGKSALSNIDSMTKFIKTSVEKTLKGADRALIYSVCTGVLVAGLAVGGGFATAKANAAKPGTPTTTGKVGDEGVNVTNTVQDVAKTPVGKWTTALTTALAALGLGGTLTAIGGMGSSLGQQQQQVLGTQAEQARGDKEITGQLQQAVNQQTGNIDTSFQTMMSAAQSIANSSNDVMRDVGKNI